VTKTLQPLCRTTSQSAADIRAPMTRDSPSTSCNPRSTPQAKRMGSQRATLLLRERPIKAAQQAAQHKTPAQTDSRPAGVVGSAADICGRLRSHLCRVKRLAAVAPRIACLAQWGTTSRAAARSPRPSRGSNTVRLGRLLDPCLNRGRWKRRWPCVPSLLGASRARGCRVPAQDRAW